MLLKITKLFDKYLLYFKIIDHGSIEEIYKREFDILNKYTRNQLLDPFFIETKLDEILNEYDKPYNEGMKIFYGLGDNRVSHIECKLILDALERVDVEKFDKADAEINEWLNDSYDTWKIMLKYAVDNNVDLVCG